MILYKKRRRYKYTLFADYEHPTELRPAQDVEIAPSLLLDKTGLLKINKGYAWDGPSGPAIDTRTFMRGSLVHDALYQLMREGLISRECRKYADRLLREICIDAGMSPIRAWWVYHSVRVAAACCAASDLLEAP